jgi:hypothetical protein
MKMNKMYMYYLAVEIAQNTYEYVAGPFMSSAQAAANIDIPSELAKGAVVLVVAATDATVVKVIG